MTHMTWRKGDPFDLDMWIDLTQFQHCSLNTDTVKHGQLLMTIGADIFRMHPGFNYDRLKRVAM